MDAGRVGEEGKRGKEMCDTETCDTQGVYDEHDGPPKNTGDVRPRQG